MSLKLLQRAPGRAYAKEVSGPFRLVEVTGINAKSTGTTALYSPTGVDVVIVKVVLRCTADTSITVPATAGVGVAAGEDDLYESQVLYGLTSTGKAYAFPNNGVGVLLQAGQTLSLGIDVAATGTSQTLAADVIGYQV